MLYERWCVVASRMGATVALRDLVGGRAWTFAELHATGERSPEPASLVVCPRGNGPDFVLTVLQAWRWRRVVCPLEPEQAVPAAVAARSATELAKRLAGVAHLKLTSATTGAPKLIAFAPEQLAADADNIVPTMGLRPDWPNVGAVSLAHSYGFSNLVLPLLLHGVPLLLTGSALPEAVRGAGSAAPALTLPGVPALWRAWHDADAIPPQVRLAISAGAPLPLALEREIFAARGLKVHNFYGSSECGGIAYDRTESPRTADGCAGSAMDNVDLRVGDGGCLEVRGPNVARGYWPEPDAALGGGVFRTADLAAIRDGLVYLRGRAADLINIAGRKVSPEIIERVLLAHPAVRACGVIGLPASEHGRGEDIVAVVATRSALAESELRAFAAARLPAWQVPRRWRFVDALPVNARGKLARAELKQRLATVPLR